MIKGGEGMTDWSAAMPSSILQDEVCTGHLGGAVEH
jgi:hypothetical protein